MKWKLEECSQLFNETGLGSILCAVGLPVVYVQSCFLSVCSFYQTLRRRNYVTPTSYLELIMTFKTLLDIKRQEIMTLKQRYVTGLEKLDFASSQVSVMQQELSDLQPELIKTSAETEKLMIKIEQDTVEVEAKKEVR